MNTRLGKPEPANHSQLMPFQVVPGRARLQTSRLRSQLCCGRRLVSLLDVIALTVSIAIGLAACGQSTTDTPLLSNASASPEEVCRRVLDALAINDTLALQDLVLTRFEHDSILVPRMPIGQDTSANKDLELAWYLLNQRSAKGIRRALADHAGQRFELVSVSFNRSRQTYGPLTLHKGTEVKARNESGEEVVLGIFGSIPEQDGRFKLVSIRD